MVGNMTEQDRRDLQRFVTELNDFLANATQPSSFLPDDRATELTAAYTELSDMATVAEITSALDDADLDEAEKPPADGPAAETSRPRLERFGLTGANLRAKLAGWDRALSALTEAAVLRLGLFRSVFRWANTLLGSIIAALGVGEALKELKEATENAYEDVAEGI